MRTFKIFECDRGSGKILRETKENVHYHNECPCCQRNDAPPTRQVGGASNSSKKRRLRRKHKKHARQESKKLCVQHED